MGCGVLENSPAPSATLPRASAGASLDGPQEADIEFWIRFRDVYDLETDRQWVLAVFRDPSASSAQFGVPLLPAERAHVGKAHASAQNLIPFAHRYAAAYPEFAGLWLENPILVLGFTDNVAEHGAELGRIFGSKVEVRAARHTLRDLREFAARIKADDAWFKTIDVEVIDASLDEMANGIYLYYRAPTEAVEALIRARYSDPDWLSFDWAGPALWTGPWGDLQLTVVDGDGRPVAAAFIIRSSTPGVIPIGPSELEDGKFNDIGMAAVEWVIELTYLANGQEKTVSRMFTVPPNDLAKVRIVLDD